MVVTRKKNTNRPGRPRGPTHLSQTLATGLKGNLDLPEANTSKGMEKNLNKSNPRDLVTSLTKEIHVEATQNTQKASDEEVKNGMEVCLEASSSGIN